MLTVALAGCASAPPAGTTHVLRPGENLYRLSRYYEVPVSRIRKANRIRDVTEIPSGRALVIPGATRPQPGHALASTPVAAGSTRVPAPVARSLPSELRLLWPVRGRVSSGFGWRNGRRHEGIDIPAPRGTRILAAEAGRVIHAEGRLGAYGKVVILKHAGRYQTVYAHASRILVRKGDFVERGQPIAEVGKTGNATGTHLHFEVRRDRRAVDPRAHLP